MDKKSGQKAHLSGESYFLVFKYCAVAVCCQLFLSQYVGVKYALWVG